MKAATKMFADETPMIEPIYALGQKDIDFTKTLKGWLTYAQGPQAAARAIATHVFATKKSDDALRAPTNMMPIYSSLPEPAPLSTTTVLYLADIRRYTEEQDAIKAAAQLGAPTQHFRLFADDSAREVDPDEPSS